MSVLRRVKLRTPDGIESIEYPLGVEAKNVEVANQENLSQRLVRIDEDLEKNEKDIAAVSELAGTNKQNIGANEIRIDALERRSASVDKKPYYFDTVAGMKAYQGLKEGDMAITLGYYSANDGGGAEYIVVDGDYTDDGGSYHKLENDLFAELIIRNNEVNIKQFGAESVSSYSVSSTKKINVFFQNAINYIFNLAYKNKDQGYDFNLIIPSGRYILSTPIMLSPLVHLIPEGAVTIYYDSSEPSTMFTITTLANEYNPYVSGILNNRYNNPVIGNSKGNLHIVNNGNNENKCISIGGINSNSKGELSCLNNVLIYRFLVGLELNLQNVYFNKFSNLIIGSCKEAIRITGTGDNSGENILFEKCSFSINNCAVNFNNRVTNLKFYDCSFDGDGCVFYQNANLSGLIIVDSCWIEAIGWGMGATSAPITFNDKQGLIYITPLDATVREYQKTKYVLTNCRYVDSSSTNEGAELEYLFYGDTLSLYLDHFYYETWTNFKNTTPRFLCHSNVKEIYYKNYICAPYCTVPFISTRTNVLNYPGFQRQSVGNINLVEGTAVTKDFNLGTFTNIKNLSLINDGNLGLTLRIQRDDLTASSNITFVTNKKYPKAKYIGRIYFKDTKDSNTGLSQNFFCNYYDDYGNDINLRTWSEYNGYKKIDSNSLYYPVYIQHIDTSNDYTWATQTTLNFTITMSASADEYIYIKNPEVLRFENYIN